jgi:hypothetical protein
MTQQETITLLSGGVDLVTPAISMGPGSLIASRNYESEARGYRRCEGYERFDGKAKPSQEEYWILNFVAGNAALAAGVTVTGATSGATGILLYTSYAQSGLAGSGTLAGFLTIVRLTGTWADGEDINVAGVRKADVNGAVLPLATTDNGTRSKVTYDAGQYARSLIGIVPGSGKVCGVHVFGTKTYAFRDNAGGTACVMWESSPTGWIAIPSTKRVNFTGGTVEIYDGQSVVGGTSFAAGTVIRIVVRSGDWSSGTAEGYMIFETISGEFVDAEAITAFNPPPVTNGSVTSSGASYVVTMPPGGTFNAINHNFYGQTDRYAFYAASSAGFAFEFDGTHIVPINTGIAPEFDKPLRIGVHANHLVLGYAAGAMLISGTGTPLSFLAIDGAAEISLGEDITDILSNSATSTVVFGGNRIGYLAGTSVADFAFQIITATSGAFSDTAVMLDEPIYLDDQGVRKLSTSQAFGDWKMGTMTRQIEPFFTTQRLLNSQPVGAQKIRSKDQYRLYFDNGIVMQLYLGRASPEPMFFAYLFTPTCLASGETAQGNEILFAGGTDGYVYQLDVGTSFDGSTIQAYMRMPFAAQGRPHMNKRYHSVRFDVVAPQVDITFGVGAEYSYGDSGLQGSLESTQQLAGVGGTGGYWDVDNWDQFAWSGLAQTELYVDLQAVGKNISLFLVTDSAENQPHTITSYTINHTNRRSLR